MHIQLDGYQKNISIPVVELIKGVWWCTGIAAKIAGHSLIPVSYTHLDVYKRQDGIRGGAGKASPP